MKLKPERKCVLDECNAKHWAKGLCNKHYTNWHIYWRKRGIPTTEEYIVVKNQKFRELLLEHMKSMQNKQRERSDD